MSKSIFVHIYLLLWNIYWLQGVLFPSGRLVSQILLAILLLVSVFYFCVAIFRYKLPKVLKTLAIIIGVFTIYGVIAIVSGDSFTIIESGSTSVDAVDYLKNIYLSLLPIYVVFVSTRKGHLNERRMRFWAIVFLVVAIIDFYHFQNVAMSSLAARGLGTDDITNNRAYVVISIVAFIPLFYKKPVFQYAILAICLYFALIGMKRGALICGIISTSWFFFNSIKAERKSSRTIILLLLSFVVVFLFIFLVDNLLASSDYFVRRVEDSLAGDSSNRYEIYNGLMNHLLHETNAFRFLFGNGANATLNIAINYAHNDWLEIAINNGLIMVVVYLIYWVRMFTSIRKSKKDTVCHMILALFFIIYFLKTFFSMSYASIPTCAATAFGYAIARYSIKQESEGLPC